MGESIERAQKDAFQRRHRTKKGARISMRPTSRLRDFREGGLRLEPVALVQPAPDDRQNHDIGRQHNHQPEPRRAVGYANHTPAHAIDDVEERVGVGGDAQRLWQGVNAVEGAGQEGQRRDEEVRIYWRKCQRSCLDRP